VNSDGPDLAQVSPWTGERTYVCARASHFSWNPLSIWITEDESKALFSESLTFTERSFLSFSFTRPGPRPRTAAQLLRRTCTGCHTDNPRSNLLLYLIQLLAPHKGSKIVYELHPRAQPMSTRGPEIFTDPFLVIQRGSIQIGSMISLCHSPGLKNDDQEDGWRDRAVSRRRECLRQCSTVATWRFEDPATVGFSWAGQWASWYVRALKTLSSLTVVTLEGSGHGEMSRGDADDRSGGNSNSSGYGGGIEGRSGSLGM
jgi:hypothetical protein